MGLIITLFAGLLEQRITVLGVALAVLGLFCAWLVAIQQGWKKHLAFGVLILWSVGLALHLLPGFNNLQVLEHVHSGPNSAPFSLFLNLDKPLIFFALLLAYPQLFGKAKPIRFVTFAAATGLLLLLLPFAVAIGKLDVELSLPHWWWLFALNNVLLTCVVEEAIFRGFLQQKLSTYWGWKVGLVGASVLFGIAHAPGGLGLMVFATLAGAGYGMAFYSTGRLWVAVGVHFLFNLYHLLFFTYPFLAVH
ncbi:hypothetical protein VEZ01S_44_00630 [Vibrio ezurae NBRC 102218]|uniref:CAAX prenyl protease 2/Lysostaphin resistance protein A-like domain-containing protein n=2 Tax=Vibrio ezurae TaxID=252583 RepID=U3B4K1_9VIBR|nr:hypothetical protein VEZ01S_44_00630 [Vibrio ezurae NBRC 102218]